jgi:ubiquinol-cytochrome c reductase iron-sulfur subunit
MSEISVAATKMPNDQPDSLPRRDVLNLVVLAGTAVGLGAVAWPFIDFMNPSKDVLALASVEVPLEPIAPGMGITVVWRGKPVFVRHRTAAEIKQAQTTPPGDLMDPQSDADRVKAGHDEWIVLVGICTHLGCIPVGNKPNDPRGAWGGWFCPCHGSAFDTSGRVRVPPAPTNLPVPPYTFEAGNKIKIG